MAFETQPSRFVRHTRRCEAEFPVPISDAGACVPHTRTGTLVGAGCCSLSVRCTVTCTAVAAKKAKKSAPRGIKLSNLLAQQNLLRQKKEPYEQKLTVMSGAERRVTRGCAGEEGAKPPDPESRGRSMTRGPRAGHDNGRRDAGPVSHTLWTQGSKGTLYVCEAVHMMRRAERQKAGSHTAHRSSSKTDDHTRDGEPPALRAEGRTRGVGRHRFHFMRRARGDSPRSKQWRNNRHLSG